MLNKFLLILICTVVLIAIYFPARHARHYEYIDDTHILEELVISQLSSNDNLSTCSYKNLILNATDIEFEEFYNTVKFKKPLNGKFK